MKAKGIKIDKLDAYEGWQQMPYKFPVKTVLDKWFAEHEDAVVEDISIVHRPMAGSNGDYYNVYIFYRG